MPSEKPRRLGRGLEALFTPQSSSSAQTERGELQRVPTAHIRPNPHQPRKEFRAGELAELEASLRTNGLLQPITVRPAADGQGYQLIAGERRFRAALQLGWTEIPALVKEVDDQTLLSLALVENLQRTDLNPIEEAEGYERLIEDFSLTQQQVADAVGKDRSTIANMLRLLGLPTSVQRLVREGQLPLGHARALLALENEGQIVDLARRIVAEGLTVREVELRARQTRLDGPKRTARKSKGAAQGNAETRRIEDQLRRRLQTDVRLQLSSADRGVIQISFYSNDDLERVLALLLGDVRETT